MKLPKHSYDDWLAEVTLNAKINERERREREAERTKPGPVIIRYVGARTQLDDGL